MNKLLATIKSTSESKDGVGSFEAVLSVPSLDRDDEVVDAKAFDPLPDHITIDIDHAMTVDKTVGSGTPYYDGNVLKFKGTYASHPLAQMVRSLVDEGHIRTMSVAYMGSVYEVDKGDKKKHLRKAELLNAGIVGISSNRDALITASKALVTEVMDAAPSETVVGDGGGAGAAIVSRGGGAVMVFASTAARDAALATKAGARHSTHDLTLLQTAHDALTALGAACEAKTSPTGDETTTDPTEKAAKAAVPVTPAEPAVPQVDVVIAKARASAAAASLALL